MELSGKTVTSSRKNSVHRAQSWAGSVIRLGSGQLGQMGVSLTAPQFLTAQRGEQHWAAPPVTQADLSFTSHRLHVLMFFVAPPALFLVDILIISLLLD